MEITKHIDNDAKNNIYGEMPIDKEMYINDVINNRIKKREIINRRSR